MLIQVIGFMFLLVGSYGMWTKWPRDEGVGAPKTTCTKSQCDTALAAKFANATRGVCACCAILYGTACVPVPPPSPTPSPVVDGGTVQFPQCNAAGSYKAPSPTEIERYRDTLRPRHKLTGVYLGLNRGSAPVASVMWPSNDPWCGDQGGLGACEAFTQLDIATSRPRTQSFPTEATFNSAAVSAYSWITSNDDIPGQWPPDDTGSDSISGCKWLVHTGYARACLLLVGAADVKIAIQSGPVIVGMNWLHNMYMPDRCGHLDVSGVVDGGHALELVAYDAVTDTWYLQNHWGNQWGICLGTHCGYHVLTSAQLFGAELDADFVMPEL